MRFDEAQDFTSTEFEPTIRPKRISLPSLGLHYSERRLLLMVMDFVLICAALVIALILRTNLLPNLLILLQSWKWLTTLAVVWFGYAALFNVYNLARAASTTYSMKAIAMAGGLTSLTYLLIPWFTPTLVNRSQGFIFVFLSLLFLLAWRIFYAQFFTQPSFQRRAFILGHGASGEALATAMHSKFAQDDANPFRGTGYTLLGFVSTDDETKEKRVADLPILGPATDLVRLVRELEIDEVILSLPDSGEIDKELFEVILDCRELGIQMTQISTIYERLTGRVAIEYVGWDVETIAVNFDSPFQRFYRVSKRLADLLMGFAGLIFLFLLIPPIYILNAFTSPGPIFYKQQRVGKGGHPFRIIKFRSMRPGAESDNKSIWAKENDVRVTFVGKWLRRLHLDELPQVINMLKGEMSLVGPRPERPDFVGLLSRDIPFYRVRHCVLPGITGWAQIHQDYSGSIDESRTKLEYDLFYIKKTSLWLDLVIMLRTVTKVLGLQGR